MTVKTRWLIIGGIALVGVSVAVTAIIVGDSGVSLPPGCAPEDRIEPGCRPLEQGVSATTVALVTVILTPIASVGVALIGGLLAHQSQDHAAAAHFENERKLREHDALRDALDDAAVVMYDCINTFSLAVSTLVGSITQEKAETAQEHMAASREHLWASFAVLSRLRLRVPVNSPLLVHFSDFQNAHHEKLSLLSRSVKVGEKWEESDDLTAAVAKGREAVGGFDAAARVRLGI